LAKDLKSSEESKDGMHRQCERQEMAAEFIWGSALQMVYFLKGDELL